MTYFSLLSPIPAIPASITRPSSPPQFLVAALTAQSPPKLAAAADEKIIEAISFVAREF